MIIRPTCTGHVEESNDRSIVYVLERRSLFNLIVLDLVADQLGLKSPLSALENYGEARSFFFLFRATGARGKVTMFRFSERMVRLQSRLTAEAADRIELVPVSVYWGRANDKQGSVARRMVSDDWRGSSGLRHGLGAIFARTDILVRFDRALDWRRVTDATRSDAENLRHVARELRTTFKRSRVVALGPTLLSRKAIIAKLATQNQNDADTIAYRRKQAKGMVANLSYPSMRLLKSALDIFWRRAYDQVELLNVDSLRELAKTRTIVFIPNHRSHVDYLILSYMLFVEGIAIPHIAAGDNMNLPVIGPLLRRCGAFFMRRAYRDDAKYGELLADYVSVLLAEGHSLEFFIEGTRSRSGAMFEPRVGMLRMIAEFQERRPDRAIALVPVFVGYEHLIESDSYRAELMDETERAEGLQTIFNALALLKARLGLLRVALGPPIDLRAYLQSHAVTSDSLERLATHTVESINDSAILNPVNLVAMAIFCIGIGGVSLPTLQSRIEFLRGLLRVESLKHNYVVVSSPASDVVKHVSELGYFAIEDERVEIKHDTLASLAWFRNNTLHMLATPAILAVVLLNQQAATTKLEIIRQVAGLLPHVAGSLKFHMDLHEVRRWLTHFKNAELIKEDEGGQITLELDASGTAADLNGLSNLIMPLLECMYATISGLIARPGIRTSFELASESHELTQRITRELRIDGTLWLGPQFFRAVLNQLLKFGLAKTNDKGQLVPNERLTVIQQRSAVAINARFQQALNNYLDEVR